MILTFFYYKDNLQIKECYSKCYTSEYKGIYQENNKLNYKEHPSRSYLRYPLSTVISWIVRDCRDRALPPATATVIASRRVTSPLILLVMIAKYKFNFILDKIIYNTFINIYISFLQEWKCSTKIVNK